MKAEAEVRLIEAQIVKMQKDSQLTEQKISESKEMVNINKQKIELTKAQALLVSRQIAGYSDNLFIKAAEFQANLASFAASSGSSSAGGAIAQLNSTIGQIKARAY